MTSLVDHDSQDIVSTTEYHQLAPSLSVTCFQHAFLAIMFIYLTN